MKSTKFGKNQHGNLLVEAMLGIALAGAGFLTYYEIEHHIENRKQFSKVTSDMYQQYNVFLTALEQYAQKSNSTQVVTCQELKNGYLASNFNCTDYLGDTLEGILIKNDTQTPTAYVVGVPSTSSQSMLHSYNVSSMQVLNQALAQSQPEKTPHEFFVINVNNYIGYPVINISQSVSFSSIANYLPKQGLNLNNNSYVISLVDASTLNPSAAPPSCYSSSSILSPPGTWDHSFTNVTSYQTCSGTVCTNVSITSITQCSYTEWQPYQYCSYVNGQTSTSNNGSPFSTSSCWLATTITNTSNVFDVLTGTSSCPSPYTGSISNYDSVTSYTSCTNGSCSYWSTSSPAPSVSSCTFSASSVSTVFTGTNLCPSPYTGSISNYDSVTSYTSCTNGSCSYWSTSSPAPSVSSCKPPPKTGGWPPPSSCTALQIGSCTHGSETLYYTGGPQYFNISPEIASYGNLCVTVCGGGGGASALAYDLDGMSGGPGGLTTGVIPISSLNNDTLTIIVGGGGHQQDFGQNGGGYGGGGNGGRASGCEHTASGGAGGGGSYVCEGTQCTPSTALLVAGGGGGGGDGFYDGGAPGGSGGGGNNPGTGPINTCYQVCTINLYPSSTSYNWWYGSVTNYTVTNNLQPGGIQVYSYWQYSNSWWNQGWNETGGWWVPVNGNWEAVGNGYFNGNVYNSLANYCGTYEYQCDDDGYCWSGYSLPSSASTLPSITDACTQSCSQVCELWQSVDQWRNYSGPPSPLPFMYGINAQPSCPVGEGGGGGGYQGGASDVYGSGDGGSGYCSPIIQNCGGVTGGANNGGLSTWGVSDPGGPGVVIISW